MDGGSAPENVLGVLRRHQPEQVIVIDAAQMNCPAGTIHWLDTDAIIGMSASTHTLPLTDFTDFIRREYACDTAFLGIQPEATHLDAALSEPVQRAIEAVAQAIARCC